MNVPTPVPAAPPDRYGAPDVDNPRDVRPFAADPCRLLTSAQLQDLGLAATGQRRTTVTNDQACSWYAGAASPSAGVIVDSRRDTLVDTYRARVLPIFEPTTVGGLPAVRQQTGSTAISCTITVGTAESQGFDLTFFAEATPAGEVPDDPCGRGLRVAEQVVANLPPLVKN